MSALLLWWLVKHCAKKRGIQKRLVEKWGLDILTVYRPCTCISPCCLIGRAPQMVGCHWIIEYTYRVSQTSRTMYSFRNYYYGCITLFHFLTDILQTHKEYVWEEVVTNASQIHTNVDYGCFICSYTCIFWWNFCSRRKLYPAIWFTWKVIDCDKPIMTDWCNGIRLTLSRVLQSQTLYMWDTLVWKTTLQHMYRIRIPA